MSSIFCPGLFEGHVAIVTGGGTGIGFAIARILSELGCKVAIAGRKVDRLDTARAEFAKLGHTVYAAPCDIREVDQIAAFVDAVQKNVGEPDILVNNAGGQFPTASEDLSPRGWEAVIRNNLNGTFFMTREVASKVFIPKKRGRIINIIANIARGFPGMVHTGAARAGVENMTKTLSIEWAQHNIQINAVAPGIIRSPGVDQYPPALIEMGRLRTPAKRLGTCDEVAQMCVYLASDAAAFVTGDTLYIDGGAHLWGDTWMIPDHGTPENDTKEPEHVKDVLKR